MSAVFIFGYGSLINSESRAKTGNTGQAMPCIISGFRREWNFAVPSHGMMAVGVVTDPTSKCNGVIVSIPNSELPKFDKRESGYSRLKVDQGTIKLLDRTCTINGNIWVYVSEDPQFPTKQRPIVQSYVDVILIGCLSYGEKFAKDWIKQTAGWNYPWIDDRKSPRYPRAMTANTHAEKIDRLLQEMIPDEFLNRKSI